MRRGGCELAMLALFVWPQNGEVRSAEVNRIMPGYAGRNVSSGREGRHCNHSSGTRSAPGAYRIGLVNESFECRLDSAAAPTADASTRRSVKFSIEAVNKDWKRAWMSSHRGFSICACARRNKKEGMSAFGKRAPNHAIAWQMCRRPRHRNLKLS